MKVTLVYPPWQFYSPSKLYPMGVGYLAAELLRAGFENTEIVDLNYEISDTQDVFKKALDLVEKRNPDILGITCWTVHLPFCLEFVSLYKKKHPGVKIMKSAGISAWKRLPETWQQTYLTEHMISYILTPLVLTSSLRCGPKR